MNVLDDPCIRLDAEDWDVLVGLALILDEDAYELARQIIANATVYLANDVREKWKEHL